jgi:serine/threonine protein kinase
MTEQRPPNDGTGATDATSPPGASEAFVDSDELFLNNAAPTDDTPTIISRGTPQSATETASMGGLVRGQILAHFELIEPLGVGGMAAVIRARDTQLDRSVALKILPPEMAADPENVRRFHQEARSAARLDHETIARVFFCGTDKGLHFIAFECVEGDNLRTIIDRRGRLPVAEALHYMLQIATGLAHASERGVVHRDIKPSNIIISTNGRAKLVDMGLARNLDPRTDGALTQSGVTLGTFDYISPEQALDPREADVRSDMYSLGCTFYHALTGQPPVPEGTAARKLHHHQSVLPLDPRVLNPAIPDDVAAILSRLMAKDPANRHQTPEQLVQDLLQASQHLSGEPVQGRDGALFVEAPLPNAPRTRPLLVAGLAALTVIVLVFLIGPSQDLPFTFSFQNLNPGTDQGMSVSPQPNPGAGGTAQIDPGKNDNRQPKVESEDPGKAEIVRVAVASADELATFARSLAPGKTVEVTVKENVLLNSEMGTDRAPFVTIRAKSVVLKAPDGQRSTLDVRFRGNALEWCGLRLEAESVELRGLRIVTDFSATAQSFDGIQLAVSGSGKDSPSVKVIDCEFVQGNWVASPFPGASLLVQANGSSPVSVLLEGCAFLGSEKFTDPDYGLDLGSGGQTAVTIRGNANVAANNCLFAPHRSVFYVDGKGSTLDLAHCTAMAGDDWALATLSRDATCPVKAASCLFARATLPPIGGMMPRVAALIKRTEPLGEGKSGVNYTGNGNRYSRLDAVSRVKDDRDLTPELFETQLRELKGSANEKVLPADVNPWENPAPLTLLQGKSLRGKSAQLDAKVVRTVFALNRSAEDLRDPGDSNRDSLVGAQNYLAGPMWVSLPKLPPSLAKKERIVDPDRTVTDVHHHDLGAALAEAEPGDTILIRKNGPMPVLPASLKAGTSVTIKPYSSKYRPILVLDDSAPEKETACFRLHDGTLTLDGLEFELRWKEKYETQSVAMIFNDASILFRNCVVTLDGRSGGPLAVVTLPDPRNAMQPARAGAGSPKVGFENCFVRGDGDLCWAKAGRPFVFSARDSLVAVRGSLLNIDPAPKDESPTDVSVSLARVTAYLGGNLIRLRTADLRGVIPVNCNQIRDCLFVAADQKSFISLEGVKADPEQVHDKIHWTGESNRYGDGFVNMIGQQPPQDVMPGKPVLITGWPDFAGEKDAKFGKVVFKGPLWPGEEKVQASEVSKQNFQLMKGSSADVNSPGADLSKIPVPSAENGER